MIMDFFIMFWCLNYMDQQRQFDLPGRAFVGAADTGA